MNDLDSPSFPTPGEKGPRVCAAVSFYLAVVDDLSFEQVRLLSEHIQDCENCARQSHLFQRATRLVAMLPESTVSTRVDDAIRAALEARCGSSTDPFQRQPERLRPRTSRGRGKAASRNWRITSLALAASLLVLILAGAILRMIFPAGSMQGFHVPASLSWNGYVLHYRGTKMDAQGKAYQVEVYQDLGSNQMHIESTMQGQFDVVVVTDDQTMLGEDMMHHVAQEGDDVQTWAVDGSEFDLALLRQGLETHSDTYLGTETLHGQSVYLVRTSNGQVLALDMHYLPVAALNNFTGPGTGVPAYQTFALLLSAQVSDSTWDMQVPPGFHMGNLPASA